MRAGRANSPAAAESPHLDALDAKARRQRQQRQAGAGAAARRGDLVQRVEHARARPRPHQHALRHALVQAGPGVARRRPALREQLRAALPAAAAAAGPAAPSAAP
jgi:phage tail protein X